MSRDRYDFLWTLIGNSSHAATQVLLSILIVRLVGLDALGQYALALSIVTPIFVLMQLNMRQFVMADQTKVFSPGDYISCRSYCAVLLFVIGCVTSAFFPGITLLIVAVAASRTIELLIDMAYNISLRDGRHRSVQVSKSLRCLAMVVGSGGLLASGQGVVNAVIFQALVNLLFLLGYDGRQIGARMISFSLPIPSLLKMFQALWPLSLAGFIDSLTASLPRYYSAHTGTSAEVGEASIYLYYIAAASILVGAMSNVLTPNLARHALADDRAAFVRYLRAGYVYAVVMGLVLLVLAQAVAPELLRVAYGQEFDDVGINLLLMGLGVAFWFVASTAACAIAASQLFMIQLAAVGTGGLAALAFLGIESSGMSVVTNALAAYMIAQAARMVVSVSILSHCRRKIARARPQPVDPELTGHR